MGKQLFEASFLTFNSICVGWRVNNRHTQEQGSGKREDRDMLLASRFASCFALASAASARTSRRVSLPPSAPSDLAGKQGNAFLLLVPRRQIVEKKK